MNDISRSQNDRCAYRKFLQAGEIGHKCTGTSMQLAPLSPARFRYAGVSFEMEIEFTERKRNNRGAMKVMIEALC